MMHLQGKGTPKDVQKAIKWFERCQAAGGNVPEDALRLARLLEQINPGE